MIVFDIEKYLKEIKSSGVSATDPLARQKINYLIEDMVLHSSYRKSKIIDKVKSIAADYFAGLPDAIVEKELSGIYDRARENLEDNDVAEKYQSKTITLYNSEMETIAKLKDERLMRLAFCILVVYKFTGQYHINGKEKYHSGVKTCNADFYRLAKLYDVSGSKRNSMLHTLSEKGLIKYYVKTNTAFRFNPDWIAMTLFTVPYSVDLKEDKSGEEVYMRVTNYDDILLYLDYYLKVKNLILCADCGCPIINTASAKCLCSDCADKRKKASDRARYTRNLAFA